jgi:hydroxymethylpyrimidine pyrophosphatase-like HAD family hydrolase
LDIDGTLTCFNDIVSPRVARAVHRLVESGLHPVMATGRAVTGMLAAAQSMRLGQGWAVCSNGAVIVRLDDHLPGGFEVTDATTFAPAEPLNAIRQVLPTALIAVENVGRGWNVTSPFPPGELHGPMEVVPYRDLVAAPATRVVVRTAELAQPELAAIIEEVALPGVTYDIGWSAWMDMTPPDVTKASGLEILRRRLSVTPGGTVAIGDGSNDIPMLRWASRAVAMGGADPEVLAAATEEGPPLADDGVAAVIASVLGGVVGADPTHGVEGPVP